MSEGSSFYLEEPRFEVKAKDVLVEKGGTAKFSCKPLDNDPPLNIFWRRNGETLKTNGRIKVIDQNKLVIENVSPEDCGEYYCVAKNDQAITTSVGTLIIKDGTYGTVFLRADTSLNTIIDKLMGGRCNCDCVLLLWF